jgi:putative phosphoesterase
MRLGVISDTHDNVRAVERAVSVFEREGCDTLVHCGDFIAPPVLPFFEGFEVHGVLGNNDGELDGLEAGFRALGRESELHGRRADLAFDGTRVAVLHGESLDDVNDLAASGAYDLVCYGHHHEHDEHEVEGCTVLNPGAHFPTVPDEHRTFATYDTDTGTVTFHDVSPPE